jgi:hypothetical protein
MGHGIGTKLSGQRLGSGAAILNKAALGCTCKPFMEILSRSGLSQRELTDKEKCGIQIPFRRTKDMMQREPSQRPNDDSHLFRIYSQAHDVGHAAERIEE